MSNPDTCAVTAHLSTAPTAITTIAAPLVILQRYTRVSGGICGGRISTPADGKRTSKRPLPLRLAQLALHLPGHLSIPDRLAHVVDVLATRQRQLHLGARACNNTPGRHERRPTL